MTTLLVLTLIAFVGFSLVVAGLVLLAAKPQAAQEFAKIRNGADWPDGQRWHR